MARVGELVAPVIFLSSAAASFRTGIDLIVGGGFVCWLAVKAMARFMNCELTARIAPMYYIHGIKQSDIAERR